MKIKKNMKLKLSTIALSLLVAFSANAAETITVKRTGYNLLFSASSSTAQLTKVDISDYDVNIDIPSTISNDWGDEYTVTAIGTTDDMYYTNSAASIFYSSDSYLSYIKSFSLPETVTKIYPSALYKYPLAKIDLPDNIQEIGAGAFQNSKLTNITLPENISTINPYTFSGCSNLVAITIGDKVTEICDAAFEGISTTCTINIDAITPPKINQYAFTSNSTAIIIVPYGTSEEYQNKWANLKAISNLTFEEMKKGQTSLVTALECNNPTVSISSNQIYAAADSPIQIYSISGNKIAEGNIISITVSPGIYIIKIGTSAKKIIVK